MKAIKTLMAVSVLAAAGAANATVWDVTMHGDNQFDALQGRLIMDFTGTWDDVANAGSWTGNSHSVGALDLNLNYTQTFTMNEATGAGKLNQLDAATCVDVTTGACVGFGPALKGNYFNNVGTTTAAYKSKVAFTPTDGGVYQWTFQFFTTGPDDASGNPTIVYIPVPTQVTLHAQAAPTVPVPAAAWLFGSGLLGLAGTARRRRAV